MPEKIPLIFFEEGTKIEENLEKARLINFPAIIFLGTKTLQNFYFLREKLVLINPNLEAGWWYEVPASRWLSYFSNPKKFKISLRSWKIERKIRD